MQVMVHCLLSGLNAFCFSRGAKIHFGENEMIGGWKPSDAFFYLLPVFGLGCELIAGNDRPFIQVNCLVWQENIGDLNTNVGIVSHVIPR